MRKLLLGFAALSIALAAPVSARTMMVKHDHHHHHHHKVVMVKHRH
jgi:hypothetical protein